tara:strand:+ start:168 stop:335 length:168 start_codon:yes stop_codon:yes gene_type:complete
MTTLQALLVGGICGFILGTILWLFLGFAIGLLQNGVEDALRQKLELDKENTDASS